MAGAIADPQVTALAQAPGGLPPHAPHPAARRPLGPSPNPRTTHHPAKENPQ
ncbi:hypothetical protein [Streptomyces piniterrae]|uniref:hypothetical protein n=1 Tax=Streptomyces piniterrae TaxID=2571125 RepID=UPI00145CC3DD|nr:hypothetical protein [Streptomyces piniterrae]